MQTTEERIYKGAKARLYPNCEQTRILESILHYQRKIYNTAVSFVKDKKAIDKDKLIQELNNSGVLPELKQNLSIVNCEVLINEVFNTFLKNYKKCQLKKKEMHFHSFFDKKQSLVLACIDQFPLLFRKDTNQEINAIVVKPLGPIRFRGLRPFKGKYFHIRIYRAFAGRFYFSCGTIETHERMIPPAKSPIGIDLGLENILITSDGTKFKNPHKYKRMLKHIAHLQRGLQRKQKGSKNYGKEKTRLANIYKKIVDFKDTFVHRITKWLVKTHSFIAMEDLVLSELNKNRLFSRSFFDASLYKIKLTLAYKCLWNKVPLVYVGKTFPSSQLCHVCGHKNPETKNPFLHEWDCPNCGTHLDRDINAAINIRNEGIRLYCEQKKKTIPDKYKT